MDLLGWKKIMLNALTKIKSALIVFFIITSSQSYGMSVCTGTMFNPIADVNWNNSLPVTIAGAAAGTTYPQSPMMQMPSVCTCPSHFFGAPMVGVGMTFWEPVYVAEVERSAGCMSTLGGQKIFGESYSFQDSEQDNTTRSSGAPNGNAKVTRMQVHWYEYPVFSVVRAFSDFGCLSRGAFAVGNFSEINPIHQNDMWAGLFSPETFIFSNWIAQLSCTAESITTMAGYHIDPMVWCVGGMGLYPLSGNVPHYNSPQMGNMHALAKSLALMHRAGALWQTIGPSATCLAHPNPFLVKGQYRIDPISPVARTSGAPIQLGKHEMLWNFPPMNYPTEESSRYLIWMAKQCCARI